MLLALATTTIAWILMAVVVVGWIVYAVMNAGAAKKETGSEIELAPNRKPYYSDEILEGRRLERVQLYGVLLLVVLVIGLPLYWVFEPDRQAGAQEGIDGRFVTWGSQLFETTANVGFNCAGCHGGMNATGGQAAYTVTDGITGEVRAVDWLAPALNTVFYRFDEDEVRFILTYGRPGSPMSAWGLAGGGPMNAQQIDTLIAYLQSIQIPREDCSEEEEGDPLCESGHLPAEDQADIETAGPPIGRGRHLRQLRRGAVQPRAVQRRLQLRPVPHEGLELRLTGRPGPGCLRVEPDRRQRHRRSSRRTADMREFVFTGSTNGVGYAPQSQGSGRMPGFGAMLTDEQLDAIIEYVRGL